MVCDDCADVPLRAWLYFMVDEDVAFTLIGAAAAKLSFARAA